MNEVKLLPDTRIEELAVRGTLSQRALKVLERARLFTVRDVAAYHAEDPRYRTLGGCGLKTRRELNQLIKDAYGTLQVQKFEKWDCPKPKPETPAKGWQAQWLADDSDDEEEPLSGVAAELEEAGHFSTYDRRYYAKCRAYASFIRERRGIPQIVSDIELHRWFLLQSQSVLSERRAALFAELCDELGL